MDLDIQWTECPRDVSPWKGHPHSKATPTSPDKLTKESLWFHGSHSSPWLQRELRARGLQGPTSTQEADAEFGTGNKKKTVKTVEGVDCDSREAVHEEDLLIGRNGGCRNIQGNAARTTGPVDRSRISYIKSSNLSELVSLLKDCAKKKDLYNGSRIHSDLVKSGFLEKNVYIGSTLVNMYAKCGVLAKAQEVFDELPVQDLVSWTALIAGYVHHGHGTDAIDCFERMQLAGVLPDAVTFSCILKACGSIAALDKGQELHAEIARQGWLEKNIVVGNALVDMYAKCGSLSKAQEVFDELPTRDAVSWNALITGYTQHGRGKEAINCFEQMQLGSLSPDAFTFACILKACGSVGALDKGREIHVTVVREGLLEKNNVVGTALVDMYVKCGALAKAQGVFCLLPVQDVVSWNVLIAGYAQHGDAEEAVECLEKMQLAGLSPDAVTFACILKACGSLGAVDKGIKIHAMIARQGLLEKETFVGNALVDMYMKCGALVKAREVFDAIRVRNVVSWNALIAGYVQHGHGKEAIDCFGRMQLEGLSPDAVTYTCVLKACGSIGATNKGQELHDVIAREGLLERSNMLCTALVDMYAKCGAVAKAQEVFDELPDHDVVLWNALMTGYVQHGHGKEALNCFEQMQNRGFSPDATTFAWILKACGSIGEADKGKEIHAEIRRKGLLAKGNLVGNALVDMYAKCGALDIAQEVFDELPVQNAVSWNALITGYAQHGYGKEALQCFEQMQVEGLVPDAFTFACVLKACGSIGATDKGQQIHAEIARQGLLEKDNVIGIALVDMYAKCGALAKAQEVFDELPVQELVLWNVLITGYTQHGNGEEAINCYQQMRYKNLSPNAITYACILKACGSIGAAFMGQELHAEIAREGLLGSNIIVGNALMDMHAKCGALAKAQEVFNELMIRDVVSWNSLISGYAQLGMYAAVFNLFNIMIGEGKEEPDSVTFTILLSTCSHSGLLDKGEMYFKTMSTGYGISPTIEHHTCMVDLFGRAGHLDNALAVIEEMPFSASLTVWHNVLGACQKWGNVKHGRSAFALTVQLEENDTTAYVCMSNVLAAVGMREDANKVLKL